MAHPNEELMRKYAEAWERGDVKAAENFYADDVVLHMPGRNQFSGIFRGKEFGMGGQAPG